MSLSLSLSISLTLLPLFSLPRLLTLMEYQQIMSVCLSVFVSPRIWAYMYFKPRL